jgi:hypothetical protein
MDEAMGGLLRKLLKVFLVMLPILLILLPIATPVAMVLEAELAS